MCQANQTQVTQFHLLGFQGLYGYKHLLFIGFLLSYIVILSGNFLTVVLVSNSDRLKIPMYFFLKHLAVTDVLLTTAVMPMILHIIIIEDETLSPATCFAQIYCSLIFGPVTIYLIAAMSYDRFLAICRPLRYASLMSPQVCLRLVIGSWFLGTLLMSSEMIVVCQIRFCGLNYVDHFYCEYRAVVGLSTSGESSFIVYDLIVSIFLLPLPFVFIVITYSCISFNILKISSAVGRRKAFSTCSSHLAMVCTCFGTLITVYMLPADYSTVNINKYTSLLCTVVTPLMNPIIYSLSNQEIKNAFLKLLKSNGINI